MKPKYIHITDPAITLKTGDSLTDQHIIMGGATYGRILFTQHVGIEVVGGNVLIANNLIEML